ncbi:hypothetical protein GCM10011495_26330 [Hymenobacter frigidus]|uniref:histidine kinase n=1 Tax=Hymenobacter frigidus TaxID=1524095 RepID=A0ABQ2A8G5_9BACT|nr:PAS domain-containing protein [Hymenobacter frigidus]GGH87434.1 hypothetical protein GCM10011495_26330 [Hymenobacter frigidus]
MPTILPSPDLLPVFNALPGATLLLAPDLRIVAASDDYLAATLTERATLVGQFLFDAFPDNPQTPEANAVANVRASLETVLATRQPHEMPPQHYDVPDPTQPGHFVERHWLPRHTSVLDAAGQVQFIIQSVQDITESHRDGQQLRESQAGEQQARADAEHQPHELRHFLEQAPVAVAVYQGPEFRVALANAATLAIWDRPLAAVQGRPVFEVLPEAATPEVRAIFERVFTTGLAHTAHEQLTYIIRHGQRQEVYWSFVFEPQRAPDGRISGIFSIGTDVTEQVLARQQVERLNQELEARVQERTAQLSQQSQRLERLFMQAPATICLLAGPELVYELVNPNYQQHFPGRQLLGRPLLVAVPELTDHAAYHTIQRVFTTGESNWQHELHTRLARPNDGVLEDRYWTYVQQPRYDEQGGIDGVVIFGFEVTEQVEARRQNEALQAQVLAAAQRQAQEREASYHLFEQTPAAIALLRGPRHCFDFYNAAYGRFFPGRALRGRPLAEAIPEAVEQGFVALLDTVFQTGDTHFGSETAYVLPAFGDEPAHTRYFDFTYQAYREDGQVAGVSIFTYDVTEQVHARQQTAARQAEVLASTQRQAQERATLYQVFEETPALICILRGPEHRYDYLNAAYQRQFAGRALAGRPVVEVFPETVAQGFIALLDGVYRTGETYFGQELLLTIEATGDAPAQADYYNLTYQAYRENGQTVGICAFAYVVTGQVEARRQNEALQAQVLANAQQRVRERETLYQVFEQTPALVALLRTPGHSYEYVNPAYQALFPGRTLVGLDVAVAVPEVQEQGLLALLDRVYQTGETYYTDTPFAATSAAGQPGPPQTAYYNFTFQAYHEAGQVAGISTFAYDVTEQVLARQEREAQRQRLERLFTEAPAAICMFAGPELVFEFLNPAYQRVFAGRQLLGRSLLEALPELAGQAGYEHLRQVYETGRSHEVQDLLVPIARAGDGALEDHYFNYIMQARYNEQGQVDGVIGFGFETTAQVLARERNEALNQELTAANQQLTRTNADLDTFIYTASHDLKAPITNIEGLLTALNKRLPAAAPPVPHLLQLMQGAVERFQRTIAQLTNLTRLQQAQQQPAESVDLAALVEAVRLDLAPLLAAAQAQVIVTVADCPTVRFAPQHLRSIVYNLLSNAVKYHHPDRPPVVRVSCRPGAGATVVLEVEDNGLGLSEGQQARLFGLFQRLHTHVEGTGVGLYMLKRIVDNADGTIAVRSQLGRGTTFTITLPD